MDRTGKCQRRGEEGNKKKREREREEQSMLFSLLIEWRRKSGMGRIYLMSFAFDFRHSGVAFRVEWRITTGTLLGAMDATGKQTAPGLPSLGLWR